MGKGCCGFGGRNCSEDVGFWCVKLVVTIGWPLRKKLDEYNDEFHGLSGASASSRQQQQQQQQRHDDQSGAASSAGQQQQQQQYDDQSGAASSAGQQQQQHQQHDDQSGAAASSGQKRATTGFGMHETAPTPQTLEDLGCQNIVVSSYQMTQSKAISNIGSYWLSNPSGLFLPDDSEQSHLKHWKTLAVKT